MSTLSAGEAVGLGLPARGRCGTAEAARRQACVVLVAVLIGLPAVGLRAWGLGATFETSDQAAMPYMVRHSFGATWIFSHSYGPVPAILQRVWAEILSRLALPMAEASYRLPVLIISLAQVALTFPLLRRMGCPTRAALLGVLAGAVCPTLVADAHYPWAYLSTWLFTGTLAMWATLAWQDDRRAWQLVLAGLALMAHCLSNCYVFALPLTLLVVWSCWLGGQAGMNGKAARGRAVASALLGWALPCALALLVIWRSWIWTGAGQIGRLIAKHQGGTNSSNVDILISWAAAWMGQFGCLVAPIAAAGLVFGLVLCARRDRRGLLAVWAWVALLPLAVFVDPTRIGHAGAYLIESVYAGSLLGVFLVCEFWKRFVRGTWARAGMVLLAAVAIGQMAVGAASNVVPGQSLASVTGVRTAWGRVMPDTGIKAAGWYVREHLPMDANIMAVHTNVGMEVPVAEYYLGRRVLAGYDLKPERIEPLLGAMRDVVDVIVVGAEQRGLVDGLDEFECVCTLTRDGEPVRSIYARPTLSLPRLDADVSVINRRYDRQYTPRHVPIPLPASPDFDAALERYQRTVRQLKQAR